MDMSNCCQDTPILYGNTQRRMRGVFPCNFGWGTRFRAQNEDFVHFWPPKTPFWVKKWPYLNYFSIYSIGMHVTPLFKAYTLCITKNLSFQKTIHFRTPKMTLLGPKKTPKWVILWPLCNIGMWYLFEKLIKCTLLNIFDFANYTL